MRFGALVKVRLPNGVWAQLDPAEAAKLGVPTDDGGDPGSTLLTSESAPKVRTKGRRAGSR